MKKCFICNKDVQSQEDICLCKKCNQLFYVDKERGKNSNKVIGVRNRFTNELIPINKYDTELTVDFIEYILYLIFGVGFIAVSYLLVVYLA